MFISTDVAFAAESVSSSKIDQSKIPRGDNSIGIYGLKFGSDGALYVMPDCTTTLYRMNPTNHADVSEFVFPDVFSCSDDFAFNLSHDIHMIDYDTGDLFIFRYTGDFTWNDQYEGPFSVVENGPSNAERAYISSDGSTLYTFEHDSYSYKSVNLRTKEIKTVYEIPNPKWGPEAGITEAYGKMYFADKPNHKVIEYDPSTGSTSVFLDLLEYTIDGKRLVFPNLVEFDGRGGLWVVPAARSHADIDDPPDGVIEHSEFSVKFDYDTKEIVSYFAGTGRSAAPSASSSVDLGTGTLFLGGLYSASGGLVMMTDNDSLPLVPMSDPPPAMSGGSGCTNCDPPTLGTDRRGIPMVSGGFTFNGITADVEYYYTPYELITVNIGADNLAEFKIYDDGGPANIKHFEFAYGMDKGQHMQESKARIEYDIDHIGDGTFAGNGTLNIIDPENAIENNSTRIVTSTVPCKPGATYDCLLVQVHHVFRAPLKFDIVGTNVWDEHRNAVQNYYNHGISVEGESLNPPKEITIYPDTTQNHPAGKTSAIKLLQIDVTKDLWIDKWGYVWQVDESRMKLLSEIPSVRNSDDNDGATTTSESSYRHDSGFSMAVKEQQIVSQILANEIYGFDTSFVNYDPLDGDRYGDDNNNTHFSFSDELAYAKQLQMQQELAKLKTEHNMLNSERAARDLLESTYPYVNYTQRYSDITSELTLLKEKIIVYELLMMD